MGSKRGLFFPRNVQPALDRKTGPSKKWLPGTCALGGARRPGLPELAEQLGDCREQDLSYEPDDLRHRRSRPGSAGRAGLDGLDYASNDGKLVGSGQ